MSDERVTAINSARVYLRESRARRGTAFGWTLLAWARNARLRAAAAREPAQRGLFE